MTYIATFFSHFGAIRFKKLCLSQDWPAAVMPVPRDLSSSCGTCVRFEGESICPGQRMPEEVEQIVEVTDSNYICRYRAANS